MRYLKKQVVGAEHERVREGHARERRTEGVYEVWRKYMEVRKIMWRNIWVEVK